MNYKEIIDNLKDEEIIRLMTELGADRYKETENEIIFPTICHNIDSSSASMKLYYYKNSHIFCCYTEEGTMSIFHFLKEYYKTRGIEYNWYDDIFKVVLNCSASKNLDNFYVEKRINLREKNNKKDKPQLKIYPKGVLDTFVKYYPIEWINDGISKEAMDKFNILYSISQNKIIIPHYDINGNLVGIRGRALNEEDIIYGKYTPVRIENTVYKHPLSLNLYGLNFNKNNIKKKGYVYLFEGEKSVLLCENFSQLNCAVAVCGSNFNKFQLDLLLKECHPKEIIICFDKEEKKGEEKYFNKLWNIGKKYNKYTNFSFVYDRENLLEMKDSPCDRGEETFNQLLKKRVKIK